MELFLTDNNKEALKDGRSDFLTERRHRGCSNDTGYFCHGLRPRSGPLILSSFFFLPVSPGRAWQKREGEKSPPFTFSWYADHTSRG